MLSISEMAEYRLNNLGYGAGFSYKPNGWRIYDVATEGSNIPKGKGVSP